MCRRGDGCCDGNGGNNGSGLSLHSLVDGGFSKCGGRRGRVGGTAAASSRSPMDRVLPLHADPAEPATLSSSSSSSSSVAAADRYRSVEQSDGRRPRGLQLPGPVVAGWTAGEDGRRRPTNDGRNRLRKDERIPPRVRAKANGVDGRSRETEGESRELSASVLFDTLVVDIRLSDELPPRPPPSENTDSRFGSVSGDIIPGVGEVSVLTHSTCIDYRGLACTR